MGSDVIPFIKQKMLYIERGNHNLAKIIALAYCLCVNCNRLRPNEACEEDRECLSRKCVPFCGDSSKKLCNQPDWFYERHGLEFPQCVEKNIDYSRFYKNRKAGETCHNDSGCDSRHCLKECSSKVMKCAESKSFFQENKMGVPKCIDNKSIDMKEKSKASSDLKTKENTGDMNEQDNGSLVTKVEVNIDIKEKAKDSPNVRIEEKFVETKEKEKVFLDRKAEENFIGMKDQVKNSTEKRPLGQTCEAHDDCMTGNCVPLCDSNNSNSYCIQPRWSFEMHSLEIPSCLEEEKFQRLEALLIIKDGSEASKVDNAVADSEDNLRGMRKMKEKGNIATPNQGSNPDTFDYKSMLKKKIENREINNPKDKIADVWKSKIDGNALDKNANGLLHSGIVNDSKDLLLESGKENLPVNENKEKEEAKINEEALAKLKKGEYHFHVKESNVKKDNGILMFLRDMLSFFFGFHMIGFFFLILPFVLMTLL